MEVVAQAVATAGVEMEVVARVHCPEDRAAVRAEEATAVETVEAMVEAMVVEGTAVGTGEVTEVVVTEEAMGGAERVVGSGAVAREVAREVGVRGVVRAVVRAGGVRAGAVKARGS